MDTMTRKMGAGYADDSRTPNGELRNEIENLRADIADLVETAGKVAKFGAANAQSATMEKTDELRSAIKANPMQAAVVGAGIGFVLGLLLTR